MFLDLGENLGTPGAPPWSPRPPIQGATFENPFRRPCLLIVTDFKPFLEVPVMFLIVVKIWEPTVPPHGAPMEPLQGLHGKNPLRRPFLLIVACWVSIVLRFQQEK